MIYLLDANVLIDANRDYYAMARVPEFWAWLRHEGREGRVQIPCEVYEEFKDGDDDLGMWARRKDIKDALLFKEEVDVGLVSYVTENGYAPDHTDDEIEKVGREPFLIAYALAAPGERCVVTTEKSKPTRTRANRHVPNVCDSLNLPHCDTFAFLRELDLKTGWKSR